MTKNAQINNKVLFMAKAALIAALYYVLTMALAPISFGIVQFRFSEVLTVLPVLMPEAVPGLFLGCLISNLLNPENLGPIDIVFGSMATMLAAISTYFLARKLKNNDFDGNHSSLKKDFVCVTPAVIFNALIVGTYLPFLLTESGSPTPLMVIISILTIGLSEAVNVYALGIPFLKALRKAGLMQKTRLKNNH